MQARNEVRIIGGLWKGRKLKLPGNAAVRPSLGRVRETLFNWLAGAVEGRDCLDLFAGSGALGFEALSRGARSAVLVDDSRDVAKVLHKNAERLGAVNCAIRRQPALGFLRRSHQQGAFAAGETLAGHQAAGFDHSGTASGKARDGGTASTGTPAEPESAAAARTTIGGDSTPERRKNIGRGSVNQWDIVFLDPPFVSNLLAAALDTLQSCNSLRPGARVYFELEKRGEIDLQGWTVLKQGTAGDTRFGLLATP